MYLLIYPTRHWAHTRLSIDSLVLVDYKPQCLLCDHTDLLHQFFLPNIKLEQGILNSVGYIPCTYYCIINHNFFASLQTKACYYDSPPCNYLANRKQTQRVSSLSHRSSRVDVQKQHCWLIS